MAYPGLKDFVFIMNQEKRFCFYYHQNCMFKVQNYFNFWSEHFLKLKVKKTEEIGMNHEQGNKPHFDWQNQAQAYVKAYLLSTENF